MQTQKSLNFHNFNLSTLIPPTGYVDMVAGR